MYLSACGCVRGSKDACKVQKRALDPRAGVPGNWEPLLCVQETELGSGAMATSGSNC